MVADAVGPVEWVQKEAVMITFRLTTDFKDDRREVLTLPPDVPTGQAELVVTVASPAAEEARRASAALLAAMAAEPHLSR